MHVRVNVYMDLARKLKWSKREIAINKDKATVRDVLNSINELKDTVLPNLDSFMVLVNGINIRLLKGLDTEVGEGFTIDIFPPAGGG